MGTLHRIDIKNSKSYLLTSPLLQLHTVIILTILQTILPQTLRLKELSEA